MKKNILKISIIVGIMLLTGIVSLSMIFVYTGYLSTTEKINANILVVEGWLPADGVNEAYKEYKAHKYDYIITTGVQADFDCVPVHSNGFLVYYPKNKLNKFTKPGKHLIEVRAFSELGGENAACFNLYVNDSIISMFKTRIREKKYAAWWNGSLSDIDSIIVEFTNDLVGKFGDRNLFVKEITIDKQIVIPTINYSVYDIGKLDGKDRHKNDFTSYALLAENELRILGVDSTSIVAIPGEKTKINRTLASAKALRNWLDTTNIKVSGVNIVSYGMHARRTRLIYSRILNKDINTGIVSLPDEINQTKAQRLVKAFRETLGIIYYRLILSFY